jgi:hypothetical protein
MFAFRLRNGVPVQPLPRIALKAPSTLLKILAPTCVPDSTRLASAVRRLGIRKSLSLYIADFPNESALDGLLVWPVNESRHSGKGLIYYAQSSPQSSDEY